MKKRNRESASPSPSLPDAKKVNHTMSGIELLMKKDGGSEITKDEEEVVETLYALAGLFPRNDVNDNSKVDIESLDANPSGLPGSKESLTSAFEGLIRYSLLTNLLFLKYMPLCSTVNLCGSIGFCSWKRNFEFILPLESYRGHQSIRCRNIRKRN